jgi:hypothetical protein
VVREAAASTTPFVVALGPVATFRPVNPVLYLGVAGDGGAEQVAALRQRVFRPPLARPHSHPFVPHVTLAAEAAPERIAAALVALGDYRVEVPVTGVTLLQEGPSPDRHWTTVADAAFGPLATVGRGGLPVDLWRSTVVDPEALALLGDQPPPPLPAGATGRVVTARRDGALLGVAAGWWRDGAPTLERLEVVAGELADVERHLLGAFDAVGPQPGGAEPTSSAGRWA